MNHFFELITKYIEITGNATIDSILIGIIGIISFAVAFGLVGIIFDFFGKYDSDIMSDCHFLIRIIVFLALSFLFIKVAQFVYWLFSFQWWIYLILFVLFIGIFVLTHVFKHRYSKKTYKEEIEKTIIKKSQTDNEKTVINYKEVCPRCGGKLIKRHGPYGNFYGCENFPTKNCKYTRKYY